MQCDHRRCAIPKLILLIKMASKSGPDGMTELEIIENGLDDLKVLGVTKEEIVDAIIYLTAASDGLTSDGPHLERSYRDHLG